MVLCEGSRASIEHTDAAFYVLRAVASPQEGSIHGFSLDVSCHSSQTRILDEISDWKLDVGPFGGE